ncbi:MAG: C1 family peptidase [Flavobacteriales bacterium]|nr:C1 family peptidase [Flavobacteriales bacterium]
MHKANRVFASGWLLTISMLVPCSGSHAQDSAHPLATGAAFPTHESLLKIPSESPFVPPKKEKLPKQVDLSPWFPPPGSQGARSSCTGWAVGYGLRSFQENRRLQRRPAQDSASVAQAFSPAFVYDYTMQYLSKGDCDQGTELIAAITVAVDNGVCRWSTLPYDTSVTACQDSIPVSAFAEAEQHRMQNPVGLELTNTLQWKHHLNSGQPILVGLSIDQRFHTEGRAVAGTGKDFIWQGPDTLDSDLVIIGHAVTCAGYDDADSTFLLLNSWGTGWGRDGWFRIPYRVMAKWCYGAFVVDEADSDEREVVNCVPADRKEDEGTVLRESFKEGQHQEFEGLRLSCRDVSSDGKLVTVDFSEAVEGAPVLRSVVFRQNQPTNVHLIGRCWTMSIRPPGIFASRSNPRARFILRKAEPSSDAYIKSVLHRVKQCASYGSTQDY